MKKVAVFVAILGLGAMTALAGTISVPHYVDRGTDTDSGLFPPSLDASWVVLKNNTASPQVYTLLYFSLKGDDLSPTDNTFSIAGNSARGWRPFNTSDGNQGAGASIPHAQSIAPTAPDGVGSITILYSDPAAPSGRVLINQAGSNSSYAYSLIP